MTRLKTYAEVAALWALGSLAVMALAVAWWWEGTKEESGWLP